MAFKIVITLYRALSKKRVLYASGNKFEIKTIQGLHIVTKPHVFRWMGLYLRSFKREKSVY